MDGYFYGECLEAFQYLVFKGKGPHPVYLQHYHYYSSSCCVRFINYFSFKHVNHSAVLSCIVINPVTSVFCQWIPAFCMSTKNRAATVFLQWVLPSRANNIYGPSTVTVNYEVGNKNTKMLNSIENKTSMNALPFKHLPLSFIEKLS